MGDHGRGKLQVVHEGAKFGSAVTEREGLVFVEIVKASLDNLLGDDQAVGVHGGIPRSRHNEVTATQVGKELGSLTFKSMAKC